MKMLRQIFKKNQKSHYYSIRTEPQTDWIILTFAYQKYLFTFAPKFKINQ